VKGSCRAQYNLFRNIQLFALRRANRFAATFSFFIFSSTILIALLKVSSPSSRKIISLVSGNFRLFPWAIVTPPTLAHYLQEVSQTLDIERNKVKSIQSHLQLHSEALALRSKRNEILASNIANAATPNFKAKDLDFSSMLNAKMGIGDLITNDVRHLNSVSTSINDGVGFRQNITPSMDGNTVELHVEQMQFSENVMRYQASLEFLNRKLTGLKSAIKGE